MPSKEVNQLVRSIDHIDGVEVRNGGKHLHVYLRDKLVVSLPKTPSDPRSLANTRAQLRRHGITPAVRPKRRSKGPAKIREMMSLDELRARVASFPKQEFGRFLAEDMRLIDPRLWTYKNPQSAANAMYQFERGGGLSENAHRLLDSAVRAWDHRHSRGPGETELAEREPVTELVATDAATGTTVTFTFQLEDLVALAQRFGVRLNFETRQQEEE